MMRLTSPERHVIKSAADADTNVIKTTQFCLLYVLLAWRPLRYVHFYTLHFYPFAKLWAAEAICFHYVLMSRANIGIFHFAWILNGFRWNLGEVITTSKSWTDYILGEIGFTRYKVAGYDRKFESTWNRCCQIARELTKFTVVYIRPAASAGLAVNYTHAPMEASYDRVRSLAFWLMWFQRRILWRTKQGELICPKPEVERSGVGMGMG